MRNKDRTTHQVEAQIKGNVLGNVEGREGDGLNQPAIQPVKLRPGLYLDKFEKLVLKNVFKNHFA